MRDKNNYHAHLHKLNHIAGCLYIFPYDAQVIVPPSGKVGLTLMTISHRPVVQSVASPDLASQGLKPGDVIVTVRPVFTNYVKMRSVPLNPSFALSPTSNFWEQRPFNPGGWHAPE